MAIEITIPRLGWSMDEGTFGEWMKADGEFVAAGDPIFTLESEKSLQEVESVDSGYLRIIAIAPKEGDTVTVGTVVAFLLDEGEEPPTESGAAAVDEHRTEIASDANIGTDRHARAKRNVSPRAARLSKELGIDCASVVGTGRTGRIRERDIRRALDVSAAPRSSVVPMSSVRTTIANRMQQAVGNAVLVTLTARADATNLVALREQYKASGCSIVPAYHDIIAKLAATTLREFGYMKNQRYGDGILELAENNIGIAVDTDAGLVVPVIRNVDQLSLEQTAIESRRLIEGAQGRKCTVAEMSGGTFSITNLGTFGVEFFTPIVNAPQSAILGVGTISRLPTVMDDNRIQPRDVLPLSLTFDHCLIDGAPAAKFLQALVRGIENPAPLLLSNQN